MQLQFFGAAGEVTGSCHILTVGGRQVLLDCGLIQGGAAPDERNREPFPFDAAQIDAVILSHAHIDHCGRLPLLRKRGFRGPIYANPACRDLVRILLADSATMGQRDAERENRKLQAAGRKRRVEALYTVEDAAETVRAFRTLPYGRARRAARARADLSRCRPHPGLRECLAQAARGRHRKEHGLQRRPRTVRLTDPARSRARGGGRPRGDGDTYGERLHRDREATLREFGDILRGARADGGNVLIPAFAVGRSQEVLYELGTHFDEWELGDWQIFLDSPMAIEASEVYWKHADLFDEEAQALRIRAGSMPPLANLKLCRTVEESMLVNRIPHGAIVIAGSGMCTGGRIIHHLKHNLARPECDVVFTGFQAAGTLGRAIVDGREYVRIQGSPVKVAARIHTLGGFSAHGDQTTCCAGTSRSPEGRPCGWCTGSRRRRPRCATCCVSTDGARRLQRPELRSTWRRQHEARGRWRDQREAP
jgi:metallo-beta-lactamase family protein